MSNTSIEGIADVESMEEAVFQAMGAASMCWENGIFDEALATRIGRALLRRIAKEKNVAVPD